MRVKQRKWKSCDGSVRTAWVVDWVDPLSGARRREVLKAVTTRADADRVSQLIFADRTRRAQLGELAGPSMAEKCLLLRDLLERDNRRTGVSPHTLRMERQKARQLLGVFGVDARVLTLTPSLVESFKAKRLDGGVKPATVNKELVLLKAALNRAHNAGTLSQVPVAIKKLAETTPERRFLTRAETARILAECADNPTVYEPLAFLANTGLRPSELWRVRWSDVDFLHAALSLVTAKKGSAGTARRDVIPLNAAVLDLLRTRAARLKTDPSGPSLVFGTLPAERHAGRPRKAKGPRGCIDGVEWHGDYNLGRRLKRMAKAAGVERPDEVTMYSLRHGLATEALRAGATLKDVQVLLRHRTPHLTLATYAHACESTIRRTLDTLAVAAPARVIDLTPGNADEEAARHKTGT